MQTLKCSGSQLSKCICNYTLARQLFTSKQILLVCILSYIITIGILLSLQFYVMAFQVSLQLRIFYSLSSTSRHRVQVNKWSTSAASTHWSQWCCKLKLLQCITVLLYCCVSSTSIMKHLHLDYCLCLFALQTHTLKKMSIWTVVCKCISSVWFCTCAFMSAHILTL